MTSPDQALRCEHCGASLPGATPEVASVVCPSCGEVTRVAGALLEELHGHERAVGAQRRAATQASEHAVVAEVAGGFGPGWGIAMVGCWLLAGVVAMPETPAAYALALVLTLSPVAVMIFVGWRRQLRLTAEGAANRRREQATIVHCPTCGGQSEFGPEQAVALCRYCGGALAAGAEARAALLAEARASAAHEQTRARHARWRLVARQNRDPRSDLAPFLVFGSLAGVFAFGAFGLTARQIFDPTPLAPGPRELAVLDSIAVVFVAAVVVPLVVRRRRLRSELAPFEELAERSGLALAKRPDALATWLIAHWSADLPGRWICGGLGYRFMASADAPPWALSFAPRALEEGSAHRHLRVFVPGDPNKRLLLELRRKLEALGLRCPTSEGGLVAELDAEALDAAPPDAAWLARLEAQLLNLGASHPDATLPSPQAAG